MNKKNKTVREIRLQYKAQVKGTNVLTITNAEKGYQPLIEHYGRSYAKKKSY
ncbi:hypothetical protein AAE02nite_18550 [Adhaeribacter aerolatus]|uniref:Uncharacterized protein n=1 Tax=Adhaeribacter aerolatus TaxID=670289 RepID=A0A512AWU1_9BACT|nr:hypothetical protein [Adhaeribacter aerolatus]GEO04191.1 hypothetical protein AAE02nite_18550 [Adhaeribacter aerolatus]